ncbi:MAG: SAM-dependent methyltransferase [Tissierellales bacterium]|nr:SAM-dependent methyltransferase [Tissierellales bacterium]MBN2827045.1 SAM-dependent methyltransferase [Tissierellales bacterium]
MKNRLNAIVDMILPCEVVADIGTDHAYVPEMLLMKNKCRRVIATELNEGPYRIAKRYIRLKGLEDDIDLRLGDGLTPLNHSVSDTIIVAGMGGLLIQRILEDGKEYITKSHTFILQPMNAADKLRRYLFENGYEIVDEELAREDHHYYELMMARKTDNKMTCDHEIDFEVGRKLFIKKHPLLRDFVDHKVRINDTIISMLKDTKHESHKAELLRMKNQKMKELLKEYEDE